MYVRFLTPLLKSLLQREAHTYKIFLFLLPITGRKLGKTRVEKIQKKVLPNIRAAGFKGRAAEHVLRGVRAFTKKPRRFACLLCLAEQ